MIHFHLRAFGQNLLTRDQGVIVRGRLEHALIALAPEHRLAVDFDGISAITPSFVDECLGRLLMSIGPERFKQRIELRCVDLSTRKLVNRILAHRASELRTPPRE